MSVVIETTIGDITVDLYLKERPNTCMNFLKLCKIKYYNLCLFHKIERNFIAQSGDPTGTGRGGESVFCHLYGDQAKYFDLESKPRLKHEKLGTLSMVNNGNNMNGSQFFLTLGENLTYLDEDHTVFGEVAEGFDILLKLNEAICDANNRPYQDIRITHTVVLHDPYEDPKGLEIPNASPEPTREQLESNYIAADEEIDENKGKSTEEVEEKIKESEAKARATILEMVGDIPDVDVKPPENVLFVCKLNPVTTSEDLEIIFSRFGSIVSCEVIKDQKTGESLQYAFIEFEKEEDCENAYFKMDNVLIDDRRIHVDFSQSVSKMNWDKNNKLPRNKSSKQNVVLKESSKGTIGYDLIFDMNEDSEKINNKQSRKRRSKTPEHKHGHSSKHKSFDNRNRHNSHSPDSKKLKRYTDEREPSSSYHRTSYANSNFSRNYSNKVKNQNYKEHSSHSKDKRKEYARLPSENSRYSPERLSKKYRNSDHSEIYRHRENFRKSTESSSKRYESVKQREKHDSESPYKEGPKSQDWNKQQSLYKYSEKSKVTNYEADIPVKNKFSHRDSERSRETFSSKCKKHASEKLIRDLKNHKNSKNPSRSSSVSSASSSSSAAALKKKHSKHYKSSSSYSDSSSSSSSDEKNKRKKYQKHKKKIFSDSHDKRKKQKSHHKN